MLKPFKHRALSAQLKVLRNMRRGFIGPIGDDLPSLIPLLFGLMIFFSTFTFTFNSFDSKTDAFQDDLEVLRIGASLRGNNYIYSYSQFKSLCDSIQTQRLKYKAGIAELSPEQGETIFNIRFLEDSTGANKYVCPESPPALEEKGSETKKIVAKVFPIAFQTANSVQTSVVLPKRLVVIVWK